MSDNKGRGHRGTRAGGGGEKHRRNAAGGRNGRPWRFMDYGLPDLPDRHFRATAWALALPGKHVLAAPERAGAGAGRDF